jgi:hypothetical protein
VSAVKKACKDGLRGLIPGGAYIFKLNESSGDAVFKEMVLNISNS